MKEKKVFEKDKQMILELMDKVIEEGEIIGIERLGGLTNHSYKVEISDGKSYVFRLPGEGTSELINRKDEKVSTELACRLGIDTQLLYFDEEGVKITEFIHQAETCNAEKLREEQTIKEVAEIFHTLHSCGESTNVPFEVFEMAKSYEDIIVGHNVKMYEDYEEVKEKIMKIKSGIDKESKIEKVPCHNDSLCENWVYGENKLYLIDWEYAGMNDGMWDLADVSIEAGYNQEQDEKLLKAYFGREATVSEKHRFIANKLYLDYLWTLWGKTRVPFDGDMMEEYALDRYLRLKRNIEVFEGL